MVLSSVLLKHYSLIPITGVSGVFPSSSMLFATFGRFTGLWTRYSSNNSSSTYFLMALTIRLPYSSSFFSPRIPRASSSVIVVGAADAIDLMFSPVRMFQSYKLKWKKTKDAAELSISIFLYPFSVTGMAQEPVTYNERCYPSSVLL